MGQLKKREATVTYIIGIAAVIFCFFLANVALDHKKVQCCQLLYPADTERCTDTKQLTKTQIMLFSFIIAAGAAATIWRLTAVSHDVLNVLKLSVALVCLTGSACVDYIEHRIPNFFPGVLAVSAMLFLVIGILTKQEGALAYLFSSFFAALVCAVCLIISNFLSHNGIGLGDIKLITALALMGGVYIAGGTLFFSMTVCALVSGYLLITKKKTMKEGVPFGPFILLGYILTICIVKF